MLALQEFLNQNGVGVLANKPNFFSLGSTLDLISAPLSISIVGHSVFLDEAIHEGVPVIRNVKSWISVDISDPVFRAALLSAINMKLPYYREHEIVQIGAFRYPVVRQLNDKLVIKDNGAERTVVIRRTGSVPLRTLV